MGFALTVSVLVAAAPLSAQTIPGIDPVKVKTIAIEPRTGKPMAAPVHAPSVEAAKPASPVGLPAPVRVRTLRVRPGGHVVRDVSGYETLPR